MEEKKNSKKIKRSDGDVYTHTSPPKPPKLQTTNKAYKKNYFVLSVKGRGKSFNDFLNDAETDIGPVNNPTICIKFPLLSILSTSSEKKSENLIKTNSGFEAHYRQTSLLV